MKKDYLASLDEESKAIANKASYEIKKLIIDMIANDPEPKSVSAKIVGINIAVVELSSALVKSIKPLPTQNAEASILFN